VLEQLPLFPPPSLAGGGLSASGVEVSVPSVLCLGMVLPADFCAASAPVQVIHHALCMPSSAAALSHCFFVGNQAVHSAHACSGGVWLWAFQNPATGHGEPWALCSGHELSVCHCHECQTPTSPYSRMCLSCMRQEFEEVTL
jgi:hypothetical protein